MKNLIIIGAGSYGREIYNLALECKGYGTDFVIKGFVDNLYEKVDYDGYPCVLGKVEEYMPIKDDVFICAIMDVDVKKKFVDTILSKGGQFINLVHNTATIWKNTKLGVGCIIREDVRISCDITIGNHVNVQPMSLLGHDVVIGDFCHLNTYSFLGGKVKIREMVTINTGAIVLPGLEIGAHTVVGAGAVVMKNIGEGLTVIGNPARIINI